MCVNFSNFTIKFLFFFYFHMQYGRIGITKFWHFNILTNHGITMWISGCIHCNSKVNASNNMRYWIKAHCSCAPSFLLNSSNRQRHAIWRSFEFLLIYWENETFFKKNCNIFFINCNIIIIFYKYECYTILKNTFYMWL